ncbi:MAG: glutaredoxin [Chlamydiae bacterium]|nr:glutaredoxin [Chlamydiota bacterium]
MKLLSILILCLCTFNMGAPLYSNPPSEQTQEKIELMLFYSPWCPYCQKVLSYLTQIHKSVPMRNIQNDPAGKEILKNQGGELQVPCLFIDGKALYESDDIIQWLSMHKDSLSGA